MKRRGFLALGVLSGLCGCRREVRHPARRIVRAGVQRRPAMSSVHLAEELGYFADSGISIRFHEMPATAQTVPLLAGGQLDAAFVGASPAVINAVARGARIRYVAGREIVSTTCGHVGALYARRSLFAGGALDLKRLQGRRVALAGQTQISEFYLDSILATAGMNSRDVHIAVMRQPDAAAALIADRVDAIVSSHFDKDLQAMSPKVVRLGELADLLPGHQYSYIAFGPTLLDGDRETGVRFLIAYLRGDEQFRRGRTPRFLEDLARESNMDLDAVRQGCRDTVTPDGSIDLRSLERFQTWAVRKRYCPEEIEIGRLIETGFLEEAHRRLSAGPDNSSQAAPGGKG